MTNQIELNFLQINVINYSPQAIFWGGTSSKHDPIVLFLFIYMYIYIYKYKYIYIYISVMVDLWTRGLAGNFATLELPLDQKLWQDNIGSIPVHIKCPYPYQNLCFYRI